MTKTCTHTAQNFVDYGKLEICIVNNGKLYCRKTNETEAYRMLKRMRDASELGAILDNDIVIRATAPKFPVSLEKIYGAPANRKLEGYSCDDELSEEEYQKTAEAVHRARLFDRVQAAKLNDMNGMCNIPKIFLHDKEKGGWSSTVQIVTLASSEATRFLKRNGYDPANVLLEINVEMPEHSEFAMMRMSPPDYAKINKTLDCLEKLKAGGYTSKKGVHYRYLCASASNSRKNTIMFMCDEVYDEFMHWACCGLDPMNLGNSPAKRDARLGLLFSNSRPWKDAFGESIYIRRVAVVKDLYVKKSGVTDFVTLKKEFHHKELREIEINAFDGMGIDFVGYTGTARDAWIKGALVAQDRETVKAQYGDSFADYWGRIVKIDDVDIILTESCFKMISQYESWSAYCDAHEALGHCFCVCIEEKRGAKKDAPYQMGQTLLGDKHDAEAFADTAVANLREFSEVKNAPKLLGGNFGRACAIQPELIGHWFTQQRMQETYESKVNNYRGGRLPRMGRYVLCAADPVAFWEHVFGLEVNGSIPAGTVTYNGCSNGVVDVCRNPHLDHAHALMHNVRRNNALYSDNVIFMPVFDLISIRLRLDYDGDHLFVSTDKNLIELARKTSSQLKHRAIDWEAPKAYKAAWSRSVEALMVELRTQRSQIGDYVNDLTKLWAWYPNWIHVSRKISKKQRAAARRLPVIAPVGNRMTCSKHSLRCCTPRMFEEAVAFYTMAANVYIDAAKHGGAKLRKPEWLVRLLKDLPFPAFMQYAKGKSLDQVAFSGSFLDMYANFVGQKAPNRLDINGVDNMVFVPQMIVKTDLKQIKGLCERGTLKSKMVNGQKIHFRENEGLFIQIASRHAEEWKAMKANDDDAWFKTTEARNVLAIKEIEEWANERGYTLEEAYSAIVATLFRVQKPACEDPTDSKGDMAYYKMVFQAFWDIFGEHVVDVLQEKKNLAADNCEAQENQEFAEVEDYDEF